jgi:hypothetical protein
VPTRSQNGDLARRIGQHRGEQAALGLIDEVIPQVH